MTKSLKELMDEIHDDVYPCDRGEEKKYTAQKDLFAQKMGYENFEEYVNDKYRKD